MSCEETCCRQLFENVELRNSRIKIKQKKVSNSGWKLPKLLFPLFDWVNKSTSCSENRVLFNMNTSNSLVGGLCVTSMNNILPVVDLWTILTRLIPKAHLKTQTIRASSKPLNCHQFNILLSYSDTNTKFLQEVAQEIQLAAAAIN